MLDNNSCINLIKKFEGFSSSPYKASKNERFFTWGYGHYGSDVPSKGYISKEEAERLLIKDVKRFENCVNQAVKVPLTLNQKNALISFAFNIGAMNFRSSTLLRKLNNQDYKGAADELLRWTKAGGRELSGLVKRRKAERSLFLSD